MATKINQLLQQWPPGTVALQSWLESEGISRKLSHSYVAAGWLERLGYGAYVRRGDTPTWRGAVYALQKSTPTKVWPGGATSLQLQGLGQYIPMQREKVWLWAQAGYSLPAWFKNHDWGVAIEFTTAQIFSYSVPDHFFYKKDSFNIEASSMERASLELAYEIKDEESFTWAAEQFQGLVNLRPSVMQLYLEACASVRVKRLVLFLGKYYRHAWANRVQTSKIDFGSGKRQVIKEGWFDPGSQITVPKEFANG